MMMMDMMALGTVPIVTKNVNVESFVSKLKEGEHYVSAITSKQLKKKLEKV